MSGDFSPSGAFGGGRGGRRPRGTRKFGGVKRPCASIMLVLTQRVHLSSPAVYTKWYISDT